MKRILVLSFGVCLVVILSPNFAQAGKGKKRAEQGGETVRATILTKYDANKNGQLDANEIAALKKDFSAKRAEEVKAYDKNSDGKLDDGEIDALKADLGNAEAKPHGKHKRKGADSN